MNRLLFLIGALAVATSAFAAEKPTVNVRDCGAVGDGTTVDTAAIQKALDKCAKAGGGCVVVPDGFYLTGSLVIGPNTTLQLSSRADIIGSSNIKDYPLVKVRWEGEFREGHRALISATDAANITITGNGSIFGPPLSLSHLRDPRGPALIELTSCTNAVLEDFTTEYQQLWSIHALFCKNLVARDLTVRTVNFNGDGLDIDSCDGVTIEDCDINTGDDAIALKSGRGLAAEKLGRPTENVVIRNCRLESSIFAAIGIGTEMSGGIRNIKIENCVLSGHQNCIFIKSRDGRGGYIEDVSGKNLTVLKSPTFVGINLVHKGIQASDPVPGKIKKWALVRDLDFDHVHVQNVTELVNGTNIPSDRPIDGLTLSHISGTCSRGIRLANMKNVKLSQIRVTGYKGSLVQTKNVSGTGLDLSAAK